MAFPAARVRVSVSLVLLAAFLVTLVSPGLSIASGPDGQVQGVITDVSSGSPLVAASVRIEASDFPWSFEASTDGAGFFQVAVPPHRYTMSAWSSAYLLNSTAIAVGSSQTVWANMTLRPAASRSARLQGYVTDGVTSAAVTVGRIVARPWAGSFTNYRNASALNASGYFEMDLVPTSYDVATDGVVGYDAFDDYPVYLGPGDVLWYNISLNPNPVNAWINGTVRDDASSATIAGARITARVDGSLDLPAVTSDATGQYSMPVPSGSIDIAADALGYAPTSTNVYVWSGGGSYGQDFSLLPMSQTVRGYLTDGVTKAPLANVLVSVAPLFFDGYYDQAATDASGGYSLAVPDDYYVVSARPTGYAPWSTWVFFFSGSTAWANGTLWPIISQISGYVTDAVTGAPAPGLFMSAIDLRTSYQVTGTVDGSGLFTFAVPPTPAMSVWVYGNATYAGNVSYVETRPYETTWVNITVDRLAAQIRANVTNAVTGLPVSGASVIAAWFYGNGYQTTDANGLATVNAPVEVGVYVTVFATGYSYWMGLLTPVAGTNDLSIALWPDLPYDVHIVGFVRDPTSGMGIGYVSVEATWGDGSTTSTTYTNATGYYDLYTVAAPQTVEAREYGYAGSQASVSPVSGDVLWVNLTLAADSSAPLVRSFTATPSTNLEPTNPTTLRADVGEAALDRADLSIW
ncbi:MAG TPA: carboxypeptidase-like regulatory domain-containing protein, partial [Thermoplasmata archaeon]|nr:carboxypeptidase-like regulatory domain-containing protein [Thermoplasmata archaeon]